MPTTRERWPEIGRVLKVDVALAGEASHISLGHNALAGLSYLLLFLAFLFQSVTGFALYSGMSSSVLPQLSTGWSR